MYEDYVGVWDSPEHGSPHLSSLGQPKVCTKREKVSMEGVCHRKVGHARRPLVSHDI